MLAPPGLPAHNLFSIQTLLHTPIRTLFHKPSAKCAPRAFAPAKSRAFPPTPHGTPLFCALFFLSQTAFSNHLSYKRTSCACPIRAFPHPPFSFAPHFFYTPLHSFLPTKYTSTNQQTNMAVPYLPPLCGAYPTRKHTIPLPTAGLPRSPHKCASLAVTV